jgi:hypothetical protein
MKVGQMFANFRRPLDITAIWGLVVMQMIFQALDTYMTYIGVVVRGGNELNPIMRWGFELTGNPLSVMIIAKGGMVVIMIFVVYKMLRVTDFPLSVTKWTMWSLILINIVYAIGMLWNVNQIR